MAAAWRTVLTVARKDLRVSLSDRALLALGLVVPANLIVLFLLFVITGGEAPTDVVVRDSSPVAARFVHALATSHSFILKETTAEQAQADMTDGTVVAVITVPEGFGDAVNANRPVALPVVVNNLETDYTNDIRRAIPLALTSFYADVRPGTVVVQAHEVDAYGSDTGYIGYLSVSVLTLGIMLTGVLQGAVGMAREYESGTMHELLLAPTSRWAVLFGKLLGALVVDLATSVLLVAGVAVILGQQPRHLGLLAGYVMVLGLSCVARGLLLGTLAPQRRLVFPLTMLSVIPLFLASGPFGPPNWMGPLGAMVAAVSPLTYGIAAMQRSFHGYQTWLAGDVGNTVVLLGFSLASVAASAWVLHHRTVAR